MVIRAFNYDFFKELKELRKHPIVFFNGCFDIIHAGHIELINRAKNIAFNNKAKLVCSLNSDSSISKLNKSHPLVHTEKERAALLKALGVDYVFINDNETPTALLMNLVPDFVIKGSDYLDKDYHEREFLEESNIHVVYVNLIQGQSSTNIYNKIEKQVKAKIKESL